MRRLVSIASCLSLVIAFGGACRNGDGASHNDTGLSGTDAGCDESACARGQGCYDPVTRQRDPGAHCTCLPAKNVGRSDVEPDTCAAIGMVCEATGSCRLPTDKEGCQAAVGCATGFDCVLGTCYRPCSTTADCPGRADSCQADTTDGSPRHCRLNSCDATAFLSRCPAQSADDGLCVTVILDVIRPPVGACQQTGTAARGAECAPYAERPRLDAMCSSDDSCEPIQPGQDGAARGVCRASCIEGQRACAAGFECVDAHFWRTSTPETAAYGFCKVACDPAVPGTCPVDELGNATGCVRDSDGRGYCLAVVPQPAGEGAACAADPTGRERRNPCAAGLVCTNGTCVRGE